MVKNAIFKTFIRNFAIWRKIDEKAEIKSCHFHIKLIKILKVSQHFRTELHAIYTVEFGAHLKKHRKYCACDSCN